MTRALGTLRPALPLVAALMLLSCASSGNTDWTELKPEGTGAGQTVHVTGTVHHLEVEGGVYVIRDATGTSYNPTNLPSEFRINGLAVEADATRRDDLVSIGMVGPMVDLLRVRKTTSKETGPSGLSGTSWRLEDLSGTGVLDNVQATLAFAADGAVSGNASCNQFHGTATETGSSVSFGTLATTRMACAEAVMNQEQQYLEALRRAERFERKGSILHIYVAGKSDPLRFTAMDESESVPR